MFLQHFVHVLNSNIFHLLFCHNKTFEKNNRLIERKQNISNMQSCFVRRVGFHELARGLIQLGGLGAVGGGAPENFHYFDIPTVNFGLYLSNDILRHSLAQTRISSPKSSQPRPCWLLISFRHSVK